RGTRLRQARREQLSWGPIDVDSMLPQDHPVRAIWAVVDRLDLSALYVPIEAREGIAGAPAIDPKVLLALWVYGTSDGEASAREIWRLTTLHTAYRWICGGVAVGYHTISDFRSRQAKVDRRLDHPGAGAAAAAGPGRSAPGGAGRHPGPRQRGSQFLPAWANSGGADGRGPSSPRGGATGRGQPRADRPPGRGPAAGGGGSPGAP
ncbi:transposase IS4 family protein, partial [mine drainage metagenome]